MARPVDWTPLGYDTDPVPGDPDRVLTMGKHYQDVAEAINDAAAKLRTIAESEMISQAVAEFRDSCEQVADDISRAHTRYRGVGDALVAFVPSLDYAQEESATALRDAESAQDEIRTSKAGLDRLEGADDPDTGAIGRAEGRLADAETALTRAKSRAESAVGHRDTHARRAIQEIDDVKDSGDLNDGWWHNWGSEVVHVVVDVARAVATTAGVVSLLVGWVPVIGQALATVLGVIALVAGVIALLGSIALAVTGELSWGTVAFRALAAASFGIGRVLGASSRVAFRGAQGASRRFAGWTAAQPKAWRAANNLPTASSSRKVIRQLTGSRSIAELSKNQAKRLVNPSRKQGWIPGSGNVWQALRDVRRDFTTEWRTVRTGEAWKSFSQNGQTIRQIVNDVRSGHGLTALSRSLGHTETANHMAAMRGVDAFVRHSSEVSPHLNRALVHGTTEVSLTLGGSALSAIYAPEVLSSAGSSIDVITGGDDTPRTPGRPSDATVQAP